METTKDMLIEYLNISDKTKEILKNHNYKTVSDLTSAKKEDIEVLFNIPKTSLLGYDGSYEFDRLKSLLHSDFKVTFLGEYDDMGLTPEMANTPVSQLELPVAIKNILTRQLSVGTLGDLLTTDCNRITKARNFGETYLGILKKYVHGLGYTLKNEHPTLKETLKSLKEQGVQLLDEVIPNAQICNLLYKNGIYTLDDLLDYGPDVYKLARFGPLRRLELTEKMKELNLTFNISPITTDQKPERTIAILRPAAAIRPTEDIIAQTKIENAAIITRIEKKEELVAEYNRLMEERKNLIQREKELDRLIQSKVNEMKEVTSRGGK